MTDVFTKEKRSTIMSHIRGKDTSIEIQTRSLMWNQGLRLRKHYGPFNIDIAFPSARVAVFIDSCFWHACPIHGSIPKTNTQFWEAKLHRNHNRDIKVTQTLKSQGWKVIRLWEHDLGPGLPKKVGEIKRLVHRRYATLKGKTRT